MNPAPENLSAFERALDRFTEGYGEGNFDGRRWGATIRRAGDNRRTWMFAEDLAGTDIVSFNLYRLSDGRPALKPCEMSSHKVIDFVLRFRPDNGGSRYQSGSDLVAPI